VAWNSLHFPSSCDLPEDGRAAARIFGYLHTNKYTELRHFAVRRWIFDDRFIGDIVWTPILPGKMGTGGTTRSYSLIRSEFEPPNFKSGSSRRNRANSKFELSIHVINPIRYTNGTTANFKI
jgi:hypothetical protein